MKHNAIMKGDCQESHCLNGNANLEMHVCSQWVGILHKSNYVGVIVCLLGRNFYESLNTEDLWGGWLSVQWFLSPSLMASVQSPDPTDGRRELTPTCCLLTSILVPCHVQTPSPSHVYSNLMNKCNNN